MWSFRPGPCCLNGCDILVDTELFWDEDYARKVGWQHDKCHQYQKDLYLSYCLEVRFSHSHVSKEVSQAIAEQLTLIG